MFADKETRVVAGAFRPDAQSQRRVLPNPSRNTGSRVAAASLGLWRRVGRFWALRPNLGMVLLLGTLGGCSRPTLEECGKLICPSGTYCTATEDGCGRALCGNGVVDSYDDYYYFYESNGFFYAPAAYRQYYGHQDYLYADYEACDDGNVQDGDGCSAECKSELCGDGKVEGDEQCDAGAGNVQPKAGYDVDACTTLCKFASRCGDHVVDDAFGEQCDGSVACTS